MATTTNYGWTTPNDTDLVKNGASAIRTTANAIDSTLGTALNNKLHAGLVLVKTQTIGTGVSSVTVTNAFSATYDAYKIVITGGTASSNTALCLRLGGITSGYYTGTMGVNTAGSLVSGFNNGTLGHFNNAGFASGATLGMNFDIVNPYLAKTKLASNSYFDVPTGNLYTITHYATVGSVTDFMILPGAGTLTGGTIAVYGYAKD